jgi:hypothetical protein
VKSKAASRSSRARSKSRGFTTTPLLNATVLKAGFAGGGARRDTSTSATFPANESSGAARTESDGSGDASFPPVRPGDAADDNDSADAPWTRGDARGDDDAENESVALSIMWSRAPSGANPALGELIHNIIVYVETVGAVEHEYAHEAKARQVDNLMKYNIYNLI